MLDCIKQELIQSRARILAQKATAISTQKQNAHQSVIVPKIAEYEKDKQTQLAEAKAIYDETVNKINADFNKKCEDFRNLTYSAVESEVEKGYKTVIAVLDEQIGDKE